MMTRSKLLLALGVFYIGSAIWSLAHITPVAGGMWAVGLIGSVAVGAGLIIAQRWALWLSILLALLASPALFSPAFQQLAPNSRPLALVLMAAIIFGPPVLIWMRRSRLKPTKLGPVTL